MVNIVLGIVRKKSEKRLDLYWFFMLYSSI